MPDTAVSQQMRARILSFALPFLSLIVGIAIGVFYSRMVESSPYVLHVSEMGRARTLTLDAMKRSIIVTSDGRVCSEPVPDVTGQIAANLAVGGGFEAISGKLKGQQTTDILSLFNRSQGIQILRDGMYRLCEAYINEAVSKETYATQVLALTQSLNWLVTLELCSRPVHDLLSVNAPTAKSAEGTESSASAQDLLKACLEPSKDIMIALASVSAGLASNLLLHPKNTQDPARQQPAR